jgi:hypothetical protein
MPGSQRPDVMNIQPHTLPTVRAALEGAIGELNSHLAQLSRGGYIPAAWMGDRISEDARVFYNRTVMESQDGSLAALFAYQGELTRIHDTLKAMEDNYRRTEGDNATLWGRQA